VILVKILPAYPMANTEMRRHTSACHRGIAAAFADLLPSDVPSRNELEVSPENEEKAWL